MAWRIVAKAKTVLPMFLRDQKPRTAPAPLIGSEPSFDQLDTLAKRPRGYHVRRPNLDRTLTVSPRVYTNPVTAGQAGLVAPAAAPASGSSPAAAPPSLSPGVGRRDVSAQGRTWKAYTFDLSTARADVPIWIPGDLVWMFSSTNATDVLQVRFIDTPGDQRNDPIPFHPGNAIGGDPFKGVAISNAAIPGATATLIITDSAGTIDGEDN